MTRIKRIDEMTNQKFASNVEYVIKRCEVVVAEDNYEQGEINDSGWRDYEVDIKSDTLEGLLETFVEKECYGHKFDLEEFVYDQDIPNRLELQVTGKLINDYINFYEPSAKEWEDFKNGKCNLSSFIFDLYIEKREIAMNLIDEYEELGIESM